MYLDVVHMICCGQHRYDIRLHSRKTRSFLHAHITPVRGRDRKKAKFKLFLTNTHLHISVGNMNYTGLAIIAWWLFKKKLGNVAQLTPVLGLSLGVS